jgi:hypothetical protein
MKATPQPYHDLGNDQTKAFAFPGTIMSNRSPQVTPHLFNINDEFIWINSTKGRTKDCNNGLVSVSGNE